MHTKSPALLRPVPVESLGAESVPVESLGAAESLGAEESVGAEESKDGKICTPAAANLESLSRGVSQDTEVPGLFTKGRTKQLVPEGQSDTLTSLPLRHCPIADPRQTTSSPVQAPPSTLPVLASNLLS